jgi:hypothetical protein
MRKNVPGNIVANPIFARTSMPLILELFTASGRFFWRLRSDVRSTSKRSGVRFAPESGQSPARLRGPLCADFVSDSVAVMRFATGAHHDGAAQSRAQTAFLFFSV